MNKEHVLRLRSGVWDKIEWDDCKDMEFWDIRALLGRSRKIYTHGI
jgi:hypothetical protein